MTATEIVTGILAIVVAYLIGSFPSAYLITRRESGKDIRHLGWGNVGGANVYRQVGAKAGVVVVATDIGKGVVAVAVAYRLLEVPQIFVLLAGLAAVGGHMWMLFLKFNGGGGLSTSIGALSSVLVVYGYQSGMAIFVAVIIIGILITHNVHVSAQVGFFLLPIIVWLRTQSLVFTLFAIALGLIMGAKFFPRLKGDLEKAGTLKNYVFHNSFHKERE